MTTSIRRNTLASALVVAVVLMAATACGSDGGDQVPSATFPEVSVPDSSVPDSSVPDASLPDLSLPDISVPDLTTTTTTRASTTTSAEPTTTTTERRTTTTTEQATTTTERATTTTEKSTTTTEDEVAAPPTTTAVSTTDDDGPSPWLWVGLLALLALLAGLIAALMRSRKGTAAAEWAARGRELARQTEATVASLDRAASSLEGPTAGDRQVWLTSTEQLSTIDASAAALLPDAPAVPGDPAGTNSATAALEKLRSSVTVCHSAVTDAERTRFELIGPTDEQLSFAAATVRRSSSALAADANALSSALDRIAPPPSTTT